MFSIEWRKLSSFWPKIESLIRESLKIRNSESLFWKLQTRKKFLQASEQIRKRSDLENQLGWKS